VHASMGNVGLWAHLSSRHLLRSTTHGGSISIWFSTNGAIIKPGHTPGRQLC